MNRNNNAHIKLQMSSSDGAQPSKFSALKTSNPISSEMNELSVEDNVRKLSWDEVVSTAASEQKDNTGESNCVIGASDKQDATQHWITTSAMASDTFLPQCRRTQRYNDLQKSSAFCSKVVPANRRIKCKWASERDKWHLRGVRGNCGWGSVNCLQRK